MIRASIHWTKTMNHHQQRNKRRLRHVNTAALPEPVRQAIEAIRDGYSLRQVAVAMNLPYARVQRMVRRAVAGEPEPAPRIVLCSACRAVIGKNFKSDPN
jgi:transposase-like protein